MKLNKKLGWLLTGAAAVSMIAASVFTSVSATVEVNAAQTIQTQSGTPKYVFMFIGDGMSYPQFQAASDYLSAVANPNPAILKGGKALSFMDFPVAGSATTFDSTSFAPDSASTATSLSTGHKTHSGVINMDENKAKSYETITEKLKAQKDYKIGIITTVNLNHATPAAYYAHQPTRSNYYEIGVEMVESGFDYFAGGGLLSPTGKEEDRKDIYQVAADEGYKVIRTQAEAESLSVEDGKAIIIAEALADSESLTYEVDRPYSEWALKDYVKKGIEVLDNDTGFFMMVEGGKIDWACHANDAGSTITDTIALSEAVQEAVNFYNLHPQDTLIIVTGDHETGGLTIGYAGTDYDTFLHNIANQKISYAKFDSDYVAAYKAEKTSFEDAMKDVYNLFGLIMPNSGMAVGSSTLVLTDYEVGLLEKAYARTLEDNPTDATQEEYILYGTYEPFTVTVTHLLNQKSGIGFTSYSHTGLPVAVFAKGSGQDLFKGYYDNTEVYTKLAELLEIK